MDDSHPEAFVRTRESSSLISERFLEVPSLREHRCSVSVEKRTFLGEYIHTYIHTYIHKELAQEGLFEM